ncbi:MAG: tetratricopeptide repeat protein [Silvanigrellales bacterium]|nr:tetratricopeptide repeat protein [Silvanigrellales bacterium]
MRPKSLALSLSGALGGLLCSLVPVSAWAQWGTSAGAGGRLPGVPESVPRSEMPFLKEQERARRKALKGQTPAEIIPGSGVSAEETDGAIDPGESEKAAEQGGIVEGLQLPGVTPVDPKTGESIKNVEGAAQTNAALLPRVELAPPLGIAAYLGQNLVLKAKLKAISGAKVPSLIAWVLGGRVICTKETCEIPLDGQTLGTGTASLMVVAYNAYGSTYTRHIVQVLKSNWNPTKKFDPSVRREEKSIAVDVDSSPAGRDKARLYMVSGNAVHAYPDYLAVVGTVPRAFDFRGRLKTQNVAVSRIQDPATGDWFALGYTDVGFSQDASARKKATMSKGGLRMHSLASIVKSGAKPATRAYAESIEIETPEVRVMPSEGGDIYVTRLAPSKRFLDKRNARKKGETLPKEEMHTSRVVVIAGQARITVLNSDKGKSQQVNLPAGVEFIVYEDGSVAPLAKPNPKRMEKLMSMTITPEELADLAKAKAKSAGVDISKVMLQAAKLAENEDWFEIITQVAPLEDRAKEDARISYYLGLANKGTYQISAAEKFFKQAIEQKPDYADAHWQLAQMNMELKKWSDAKENLGSAEASLASDDSRRAEIPYYSGVVNFNTESTFAARNDFTRALWETNLDAALKQSSGSFLSTLGKRKNWSLVVPVGVQYDHNALGLASDEEVPAPFPKRSLLRGIAGAIYNWDTGTSATASGTYLGAGAKALAILNVPRSFKSLDALVGEVSVSQTFVSVKKGEGEGAANETSAMKLSQAITAVFVDSKLSTQTFTLGYLAGRLDLSLGFELDAVGKGDASRSAILARQGYGLTLYAAEGGGLSFDADALLEERYTLKANDANGHELQLSLTPAVSLPFSARATSRLGLLVGGQYKATKPAGTVLKAGPSLAFNYFLAPWLLSVTSLGYEFNQVNPGSKGLHKPNASVMLTGLF